jgi:hypothetical protein
MDIETQKRYAEAMETLINEVQTAIDAEIFEYAERLDCSEHRAQDSVIDEFITSGENLGQIEHGITSPDLSDFFQWLMTEIFYEKSCRKDSSFAKFQRPQQSYAQWKQALDNPQIRDLSKMNDAEFKDWLKEERETREEIEKAKSGDVLKSMLGIIYGRN